MQRKPPTTQILALFVTLSLAFAWVAAAQQVSIAAGDDGWATPRDGTTFKRFDAVPVPAACGTEEGVLDQEVTFGGRPLTSSDPDAMGTIDTIVRRLDSTPSLEIGEAATVNLQIKALSLESLSPVDVACPDGSSVAYNVSVYLSPLGQSVGEMDITRTHPDGGTFSSRVNVTPKLYFTPAGPKGLAHAPAIELDCGDAAIDCGLLENQFRFTSSGTPWTIAGGPGGFDPAEAGINLTPAGISFDSDGDGSLDSETIGSSNFAAAVEPETWEIERMTEEEFRAQHCVTLSRRR